MGPGCAPPASPCIVCARGQCEGGHLGGRTDGSGHLGNRRGLAGFDRDIPTGSLGGQPALYLDVQTDADLGRVAPILGRLMEDTAVGRQVSLLRDVQGKAIGRVILEATLKDLRPKVELSAFNLHARDPRLPWPVDILSGRRNIFHS